MVQDLSKGILKTWNDDKGFGFIKSEEVKRDTFIHISALKDMSRRPTVGDVIYYQLAVDNDGKARAVNARIEGVPFVDELPGSWTLSPVERNPKRKHVDTDKTRTTPYKARDQQQVLKRSNRQRASKFVPILIFLATVTVFYDKVIKQEQHKEPAIFPSRMEPVRVKTEQYQCQRKTRCSEMTSCEEAIFYLHNCPGTITDGDLDGIPCED
jgi:uncharacterized repeat protein (TIGR01451 family)